MYNATMCVDCVSSVSDMIPDMTVSELPCTSIGDVTDLEGCRKCKTTTRKLSITRQHAPRWKLGAVIGGEYGLAADAWISATKL